jgi:hypothetical protein
MLAGFICLLFVVFVGTFVICWPTFKAQNKLGPMPQPYATCLMTLMERLEAAGYNVIQINKDYWTIAQEPSFVIRIHSLSPDQGDFIASYGIKEPLSPVVNYLTLPDWLDRLEYIAFANKR